MDRNYAARWRISAPSRRVRIPHGPSGTGEVLMTWLIVVLVVIAVVAISAVLIEQRRTGALRSRFGPEYDRLLERSGDRKAADAALRERIRQHKALDLTDLSPAARERYVVRWREVQAGFVDDPRLALVSGVQLVEQAAAERGYRAGGPDPAGNGDGETPAGETPAGEAPAGD